VIAESDGSADQELALPGTSIELATFELEVEEAESGYVKWTAIEDIALAGPSDSVFVLDSEAGTVRFGDNVRGRIPRAGRRVRVVTMRSGGGERGNLLPGSLTAIQPTLVGSAAPAPKMTVQQDLDTAGASDAE